jgi:hypothetical protein
MERCLRAAAAVALATLAAAAGASADSRLIVGVDDDWLKWTASPERIVAEYGDLNLGALRVTLARSPASRRSTACLGSTCAAW